MDTMFSCNTRSLTLFIVTGLLHVSAWAAHHSLHCDLFAGGETFTLDVQPSKDIYNVIPLDLARFRFKALAFGDHDNLHYIKLQVYYRSGPEAILLHQVKYFPPFTDKVSLSGTNYVYSPDLGHELVYQCGLTAAAP
jgi:hypothetical protein